MEIDALLAAKNKNHNENNLRLIEMMEKFRVKEQ